MTCRRQMSTSMDGLTLSITLAQAKKDAISAMDQALEIAEVLRHGGSRFSYRANVKRRQNAAVTLAMRDRSRLRSTRLLGVNFWSKHDEQKMICAVRGLIQPGSMCGSVIGTKVCGYSGPCKHQQKPESQPKDEQELFDLRGISGPLPERGWD